MLRSLIYITQFTNFGPVCMAGPGRGLIMNNKNNKLSETDLQVLAEQFCDQWCKYPDQVDSEHSLLEHCEYCPISKLLESNYNNICSYYEEK